MIQVLEASELSHAPPPPSSTESTVVTSIDSSSRPTSSGTSVPITTTNSPDTSSYEATAVVCRGGQSPNARTTFQAPSFDASSGSLEAESPPDVKGTFEELCPVCGDKVSGYHYGLLTCESCKGFFKRTVQNKKSYTCVDSQQCPIDKSQRKRCPHCRFQKCLKVGMKLEAVRQDRMRGGRNKFGPMYKRHRALKQQQFRLQQHIMGDNNMGMEGSGEAPNSPLDIKPDPVLLQTSLSLGFDSSVVGTSADLSSMAAVMAAEVASTGCMDGMRKAHDGVPTSTPLLGGHSYVPFNQPVTCVAGRGVPSIEPHGKGSEDETGSLIHAQPQQHDSFQQLGEQGRNTHHPPPTIHPPHSPTPPVLDIPYLLPADHPVTEFSSQTPTRSGTSPHSGSLDFVQGFQLPELTLDQPALPSLLCEVKANLLGEEEMKHKMLSFLSDTLRQMSRVDHLEQVLHIGCSIVDQLLFLMVEWARDSPFFKEIQVEDQMKLLQHSWSEILILDFVFRQVHGYWGTELTLPNGLRLNFALFDKLGLSDMGARLGELIKKCTELKVDYNEYMCLKFLILLNPDITGLDNQRYVEQSQEKVNAALLEYCLSFYPHLKDKFGQILLRLPEIRMISICLEEFLYCKHLNNQVPDQTLLTEMLHSRRK